MRKSLVITAAFVTMLLLAGCGGSAAEESVLGTISDLQDLEDVEQLRAMFGEDDGEIRLVLLLSPT